MDDTQAKQLVQETFRNDLDAERLVHFTRELLDGLQIEKKKCAVWKEYDDYLDHYELVGTYTDQTRKELDVIIVKLKRTRSRDLARTMQRNFIAKYLKTAGRDAALVAFYGDDPTDWRFSFVKLEYQLKKEGKKVKPVEELTPVKRYSFLVGKNEPNHTCQKQFLELLKKEDTKPTLEELERAFSIDKVTKEFFDEYKERFLELKETLDRILEKDAKTRKEFEEKNLETVDFAKKLLGQIVFLYFLQKKGWLGLGKDPETKKFYEWGKGPKDFIRRLFDKKIGPYENFFNDILEPLFYEALATQRDEDYYSKFKCKIPFLDGGLFEPINGYDWTDARIPLPNKAFERILDTFDRFNFTVKEDEPLDKEVAVDPEMLGKVFENLLEVKDRKSKGAFYTPREIVHYMCQQSLINYLETNTALLREDIEAFIQDGNLEEIPESIRKEHVQIDNFLKEIKVVDPAVGSGAFPVGMMSEIVKARTQLNKFFDNHTQKSRTNYALKRETIENCLYGVDIDSSAIEIAKLRFWLSLVVDEDDMDNVKPLPNLDHKLMVGNSLLEEFNGVKLFDDKLLGIKPGVKNPEVERIEKEIQDLAKLYGEIALGKQKGNMRKVNAQIDVLKHRIKKIKSQPQNVTQFTLDETPGIKESQRKLTELKKLQKQFFNAQGKKEKAQCKNQIDKLEWELIEETMKEHGSKDAIKELEQFKKNKSKPFFLWKLYFFDVFQRENPGFDIVLANPPYVEHKKLKEFSPIFKRHYQTYSGTADLYVYFYELGFNVLRANGTLTYITSNKFMKTSYGANLRKYFTRKQIQEIIDFTNVHVFEALVASCLVILVNNHTNENKIKITRVNNEFSLNDSLAHYVEKNNVGFLQSNLSEEIWKIENERILDIKENLDKIGTKIKNINGVSVYRGITTGFNPAYVVDCSLKQKFIALAKDNQEIIKPLLQGRNIKKWTYEKSNEFLIQTGYDLNIPKQFPSIFEHLSKHKKELEERADQGKNWWNLRACKYYPEFEKEKIIWGLTADKWAFAYDNEGNYLPSNGYILTSTKIPIKLILAQLNSRLLRFYFGIIGIMTAGGAFTLKHETIIELPIVYDHKNSSKILRLVDDILAITKNDSYLDNASMLATVEKLEGEIDQLIYGMYRLTPDEISIIESATQKKDFT